MYRSLFHDFIVIEMRIIVNDEYFKIVMPDVGRVVDLTEGNVKMFRISDK